MGYKSTLRSLNAAANKASREAERSRKKRERELEREKRTEEKRLEKLQKSIDRLHSDIEKIRHSLDELYTSGKVDKKEYENLGKRMNDITEDVLLVGKGPIRTLAKRYLTGKIDKDEFEQKKMDILPQEMINERLDIDSSLNKLNRDIHEFIDESNIENPDMCQHCGKKKSLLNWLHNYEGLRLCGRCRRLLKSYPEHPGFTGSFYVIQPFKISLSEIDDKVDLQVIVSPTEEIVSSY